jgi:hypothetical protein
MDEIDEWFKVGHKAATKPKEEVKAIPDGVLRGRLMDPKTKKPAVTEEPNFDRYYPAYKR